MAEERTASYGQRQLIGQYSPPSLLGECACRGQCLAKGAGSKQGYPSDDTPSGIPEKQCLPTFISSAWHSELVAFSEAEVWKLLYHGFHPGDPCQLIYDEENSHREQAPCK